MNAKSFFIPLGVFILLVIVLAAGFTLRNPHLLPSHMINKPFPQFKLTALDHPGRMLTTKDIKGKIALVNVWATWCPNCLMENPEMIRIARTQHIPIYGIDYNDNPAKAARWLKVNGNPYKFVIVDRRGTLGLNLGVYGAPETFIVDAKGIIHHRQVGPIDQQIFENTILPIIERLRKQQAKVSNS